MNENDDVGGLGYNMQQLCIKTMSNWRGPFEILINLQAQ